MSREWKPGDVARTRLGGTVARAVGDIWILLDDGHRITLDHEPRPLVVIDPEDREAVERLRVALAATYVDDDDLYGVDEALREFANPTPPKPDEPTGLGAVVRDGDAALWVRHVRGQWACLHSSPGRDHATWQRLCDDYGPIEVVREGVAS